MDNKKRNVQVEGGLQERTRRKAQTAHAGTAQDGRA